MKLYVNYASVKIIPIATVTNYCKLSGWKEHQFILWQFWSQKSEMSMEGLRFSSGWVPSGGCGGESVLCLFQPLLATASLWFLGTWLHHSDLRFHSQFTVSHPLTLPSSVRSVWLYQAHLDHPGSPPHLRILIFCRFPFALQANIHSFQGLGHGHL